MNNHPIDQAMEAASAALARMRYLECERLCLQALTQARSQQRWDEYARILLPLQEARRQRRLIAVEGVIRLGSTTLPGSPADWFEQMPAGCLVLTQPHDQTAAADLLQRARERERYIEVLRVDNPAGHHQWTLRSIEGADVSVRVPAPEASWIDRWFKPGEKAPAPARATLERRSASPADWYLDAAEALGDAALAQLVEPDAAPEVRLGQLEACLQVVADHEIIHQTLWAVAKQLRLGDPAR